METSVLILNANYEPIHVCDIRRAMGLMLTEKADLVMNGRGIMHTASATFPIPSIIRLQKMVHAPHPQVPLNRREIFRRDNYTCQYCGKTTPILTIDHVIPRHLNGKHTWENVVAACPACNHRKGGRTLEESGMHLLHTPKIPPQTASYVFAKQLVKNAEWDQYLSGW
jgi:5-methylcytosine-specific restriction endonuclease McrA